MRTSATKTDQSGSSHGLTPKKGNVFDFGEDRVKAFLSSISDDSPTSSTSFYSNKVQPDELYSPSFSLPSSSSLNITNPLKSIPISSPSPSGDVPSTSLVFSNTFKKYRKCDVTDDNTLNSPNESVSSISPLIISNRRSNRQINSQFTEGNTTNNSNKRSDFSSKSSSNMSINVILPESTQSHVDNKYEIQQGPQTRSKKQKLEKECESSVKFIKSVKRIRTKKKRTNTVVIDD